MNDLFRTFVFFLIFVVCGAFAASGCSNNRSGSAEPVGSISSSPTTLVAHISVPVGKVTDESSSQPKLDPVNKNTTEPDLISVNLKCWKGKTDSGAYEISWPQFLDPSLSSLQAVLDGDAVGWLAQLYFWEGTTNELNHRTIVEFSNRSLVSVRSETFYSAATAAHPQAEQDSYLWDIVNEIEIEPFAGPSDTSIFIDEESFLAFYSYATGVAAKIFSFTDIDKFNRFSPMHAVIVSTDGLTASWNRTGALPLFDTFLAWDEIVGVNPLVLGNVYAEPYDSFQAPCREAPLEELFHG